MTEKRIVRHTHNDTELESLLILPEENGTFPAILLIHEYTGLTPAIINHAQRLAGSGYAVLAADFYGINNRPADVDEARTVHRIYRNDRLLMRERAKACFKVLAENPKVDSSRIHALGFSFGGGAVLELARSKASLSSAVSVYGYLDTSHPVEQGTIKCPLLAIHVEDDPVVPKKHAAMFEAEMKNAGVNYTIMRISEAKHGFANPENAAFDGKLAETMWADLLGWFESVNS